jgi:hypothetical protein
MEEIMFTQASVVAKFMYNAETGVLRFRTGRYAWQKAGGVVTNQNGYQHLMVWYEGSKIQVSRIIWLYMTGKWPELDVEHADGNSLNNCWTNLREATRGQNNFNQALRSDNTSGVKGVNFHKNSGKWRARIKYEGYEYCEYYNTQEEANAGIVKLRVKVCGEFARNK